MALDVPNPLLTRKTLVTAKLETTANTDANPSLALDAFLVSQADITVDFQRIQRSLMRGTLSPIGGKIGRKLVSVSIVHEIKGSGSPTVRPKIGTLLRGAGFEERIVTAGVTDQIDLLGANGVQTGPTVVFGKSDAPTQYFGTYVLTCVVGGANGTAAVRVSQLAGFDTDPTVLPNEELDYIVSQDCLGTVTFGGTRVAPTAVVAGTWAAGDVVTLVIGGVHFRHTVTTGNATPTAVATALAALIDADTRLTAAAVTGTITIGYTSGAATQVITDETTEINLGGSGATVTMDFDTGSLVAGESWTVRLFSVGYHYKPRSENYETLTIYVYYDGMLHKITGCSGSVSFACPAGDIARATFNFQGQYQRPTAVNMRSVTTAAKFEATEPEQVEKASLVANGYQKLVSQQFTLDMANTLSPRIDMNGPDGFNGVRITNRNPTGTLNPEAQTEHHFQFWKKMEQGSRVAFGHKVGQTSGNRARFTYPESQITGIGFGDRDGTRVFDIGLEFTSSIYAQGDDEVLVSFD